MSWRFKTLLIVTLLLVVYSTQAQPGMPGGPPCWPPPCIPIDGGISIFTFLSIVFGYKFLSKNK
tara:strand:+ start:1073 stop:1264 length:192 start_codon:yes stop_codon:yes gene_type:complete